jgi:hypothetical protein
MSFHERLTLHRGDSAHVNTSNRIAQKSIILVKDSLGDVPLGLPPNGRILSVTVGRRADLSADVAFNGEVRGRYAGLRAEFLVADDPSADYARMERATDSADVTIVSSYIGSTKDRTRFRVVPESRARRRRDNHQYSVDSATGRRYIGNRRSLFIIK